MESNTGPEPEAFDQFFDARFVSTADTELKRRILQRTTTVLRRRRRLKRCSYVAALAACYLAGLGTMRLLLPPPKGRGGEAVEIGTGRESPEQSLPLAADRSLGAPPAVADDPEVPAFVLERMASASTDRKAHFYRLAGDRYLQTSGDMQSALRCYAQALRSGKQEDLVIAPEDNWLLMALKKARQEEIRYAPSGS
jgi:hypothetical protein